MYMGYKAMKFVLESSKLSMCSLLIEEQYRISGSHPGRYEDLSILGYNSGRHGAVSQEISKVR
jgi:hypothetical protein